MANGDEASVNGSVRDDGHLDAERVLPLAAETLVVSRQVRRTRVHATVRTEEHEETVDELLTKSQVDIRRIPVDRVVTAVPPTREEDGVLIVPVIAERLVVERRLVLVEEVHIRQLTRADRHVETVALKRQTVVVERTDLGVAPVDVDAAGADAPGTTTNPGDHR